MRILLAVDGSRCSEAAARSIGQRPWPDGSTLRIVTVVHTYMPTVPDPTLTGVAMHWTALEEDRERAPGRLRHAQELVGPWAGIDASTAVLDGEPAKAIVDDALAWQADLVVVGSHGHSVIRHMTLGSVSERVASHAHCSVEIVRCPHAAAQG